MKLTLLGILAVFLTQAGFIAYTALERRSNEVVAARGVSAAGDDLMNAPDLLVYPDAAAILEANEPEAANTDGIESFSTEKQNFRRLAVNRTANRASVTRKVRPSTTEPSMQTITVGNAPRVVNPRVVLTGFDAGATQAYSKPVRRTEKRSFASKSVSIIKKPYDLLKLLGSKLM